MFNRPSELDLKIIEERIKSQGIAQTHSSGRPREPNRGGAKVNPERDVLRVALQTLKRHPRVAWVRRMNVGRARGVKFGFIGCADILGQMKDGRLLAIETKRTNGREPSLPQQTFIAMVKANHGIAGIVRSVEDLLELLA
jgi:hypothetical protein